MKYISFSLVEEEVNLITYKDTDTEATNVLE